MAKLIVYCKIIYPQSRCENWYCDAHVQFESKVDEHGVHDPENGRWSRVCEACFKRREGYNDTNGKIQSL